MHRRQLFTSLTAFLSITTTTTTTLAATVKLDGNPITIGSGGYPRAIVRHDGNITASYGKSNSIVVRHSGDLGKTWSEEYVVRNQSNPSDNEVVDINNAFLYQKPNGPAGEVFCAYRRHIKDKQKNILELNIELSQSNDGGKTWRYLSSINHDIPREGVKGDWEPFLRHNVDDKLEVYWAHEVALPNQNTVKKVSEDNGKSWGPVLTMTGKDIDARDGMAVSTAIST